jgi:hypothetical protein
MALKSWEELEAAVRQEVEDDEKVLEALERLGETKLSAEAVRAVHGLVIDVLRAHERLLRRDLAEWAEEHLS